MYRRQVYGFNCLLMSVVVVVIILVSAVPSFNYRDNILSSFWFSITSSFLLLSGLLSLLLTHQLDKPCFPPESEAKKSSENTIVREEEGKKKSNGEEVSKRGLCLGTASCLASCLFVLLPGILGLIVLGVHQQETPYLLLVHDNHGSQTPVSLSILSGLAIQSPPGNLSTISGPPSTDCSFSGSGGSLRGSILLVNSTRPACRALLASGDLVDKASKVS